MSKSFRTKILVYIAAGAPPIALSAFWLSSVPPLWLYIDSTSILLWPTSQVPHYPPLYPIIVHLFESLFGLNSRMLYALLLVQHIFLASSIVYLGSAFKKPLHALIASAAAVAGTWVGSFAHTASTQGFELPFLALLCGVALRYHLEGWRLELLPMFLLSVVGLALVRQASIIFAFIVPLYFILLALCSFSFRSSSQKLGWLYVRNAIICCMGIVLALGASSVVTRAACLAWHKDCSYSTIGKRGCYRIFESFNRVPTEQRDIWLAAKTAGLPPAEAFALKAMTNDGCWLAQYTDIAKAFPNDNPDRLMNAAFVHFLISPDRFSIEQMLFHLNHGMYVNRSSQQEPLRHSLIASTLPPPSPPPSPHDEARRRLGETPEHRHQLTRLADHAFVQYYAWFTYNYLNVVAILSLVAVMIFGGAQAAALGLSFVLGSLIYLIIVSAVIPMLQYYVAPVNFLMYMLVALSTCTLVGRLSDLRARLSHQREDKLEPRGGTLGR